MSSLTFDVACPTRHAQIRMLSRFFAWLFAGIAILYGVVAMALVAGILIDNPYLYFGPKGGYLELSGAPPDLPDIVSIRSLVLWERAFFGFMVLLQFVPGVLLFHNVRGLFSLYAGGVVFGAGNAVRFKHIGVWLIAYAVATPGTQIIMRLTGTAIDRNWFHATQVHALILGGLLFVVSLVMEVGREIEQERAEFV